MMLNRKLIGPSDVSKILRHYESSYLYFDDIKDYRERRRNLLKTKKVDINSLNDWFDNNFSNDRYTRVFNQSNTRSRFSFNTPVEDVLYISLPSIGRDSIGHSIHTIKMMNPRHLIIDLRDCAGGDFNAAIDFAGRFIQRGEICSATFRNTEHVYNAKNPDIRVDFVFLFINKNTMSSAEMLATTMYLNMKNCLVIGSETFGKYTGQTLMRLRPGNIAFSMTAFTWSISGKDPSIFSNHVKRDRIIHCDSTELNDFMSHVYSHLDTNS